jgi:hypothetical protein
MKCLDAMLVLAVPLRAASGSEAAFGRGGHGGGGAHFDGGHGDGGAVAGRHLGAGNWGGERFGDRHFCGEHFHHHDFHSRFESVIAPLVPRLGPFPLPFSYYYGDYGSGANASLPRPPVHSERGSPQAKQAYSWYWRRSSKTYYPYAKECPEGWKQVAPQAPPALHGRGGVLQEARRPTELWAGRLFVALEPKCAPSRAGRSTGRVRHTDADRKS